MEERKYYQRFHQARMSHLLNCFSATKNLMLVLFVARVLLGDNMVLNAIIFVGYLMLLAITRKLEQSNISNNKPVLILAHSITLLKIFTCISATIRRNETAPTGLPIGVVISIILTIEALKTIEPNYIKAIIMFSSYWSFYLGFLCIYYKTYMTEQWILFACLFWFIFQIYRENYNLSNSLWEIFYDFHNDPVLILEKGKNPKANNVFVSFFRHKMHVKEKLHHSQMISEILNPEKVSLDFMTEEGLTSITLAKLSSSLDKFRNKELILKIKDTEKMFMLSDYKLDNIYNVKTICVLKDTSHIHQLQKAKSQVEFRSVIMGCLTHELRTPVNWVMSMLNSLEDYILDSEEARKVLNICQGTIEMLKSLTEDFIDFTRFENEQGLPINKNIDVDIREFFAGIQNIFEFQAAEKEIQFTINIPPKIPTKIQTDPKRLKQILLNLLSNAFKFTKTGKISVNLRISKEEFWMKDIKHELSKTSYKVNETFETGLFGEREEQFSNWVEPKNFRNSNNAHKTISNCLQTLLLIDVVDTGMGIKK